MFRPYWLLWYFFALIIWRMILPIWLQLRWPLATAVVVGLLAGVTNHIGYYFSLSRILVFLPFFVAGALARQGKLCLPSIQYSKVIAISILIAAGFFAWYGSEQASVRWLYGSYHYGHFDKEWIDGIAIRFGIYLVSAASCLSVIVLAPKRWTIWAWVGIYSLYPYVLHGMVVRFAESKHVYRLVEGDLQVMILVSLAVGATFLLALRPARACVDGVLAVFRGVLIKGPKGTVGQARGGRSGSAVVQSQG
ncbi:acyltransferase family protein [Gilvimarinus sp. F26214L]|uniref:acyltransferase family protein n=1 Tax=Gilvimarinus sp. DZF01 TaxID=3461371 RepID=UPI004045A7CF